MLIGILFAGVVSAEPSTSSGQAAHQFDHYSKHALLESLLDRIYPTPELRLEVERAARRWLTSIADSNRVARPTDQPIALYGHTVRLETETFDVFVPSRRPEAGYGLLIYIPPEAAFQVPEDWRGVLDRRGILVVAPRNAGNGHPVMFRRIPLALHAHESIVQRFPIDPERSYVGGWSGGSRVAMTLALAHPELFRGALLIAGTDPIGNGTMPFPGLLPTDPSGLDQLRESRLILLTGDQDRPAIRRDRRTLRSIQEAGLKGIQIWMRNTGHTLPDARSLAHALNALDGEP